MHLFAHGTRVTRHKLFRFPVLDKYFRREEQQSLVEEDREAGKRVALLLGSVIAAGSSLGIIAVALLLLFG